MIAGQTAHIRTRCLLGAWCNPLMAGVFFPKMPLHASFPCPKAHHPFTPYPKQPPPLRLRLPNNLHEPPQLDDSHQFCEAAKQPIATGIMGRSAARNPLVSRLRRLTMRSHRVSLPGNLPEGNEQQAAASRPRKRSPAWIQLSSHSLLASKAVPAQCWRVWAMIGDINQLGIQNFGGLKA